mgnify:CR=1 FL=1
MGGDGDNYNGWDTDDEEAEQKKIDEDEEVDH